MPNWLRPVKLYKIWFKVEWPGYGLKVKAKKLPNAHGSLFEEIIVSKTITNIFSSHSASVEVAEDSVESVGPQQ